jgi:hypothetical protein
MPSEWEGKKGVFRSRSNAPNSVLLSLVGTVLPRAAAPVPGVLCQVQRSVLLANFWGARGLLSFMTCGIPRVIATWVIPTGSEAW